MCYTTNIAITEACKMVVVVAVALDVAAADDDVAVVQDESN